jgi:hypothetical protein
MKCNSPALLAECCCVITSGKFWEKRTPNKNNICKIGKTELVKQNRTTGDQ